MIRFKKIGIDAQELISNYLKSDEISISELTFSNLFMWRHHYNTQYAVIDGLLCIISAGSVSIKPFAFFPFGLAEKSVLAGVINKLVEYFRDNNWNMRFERITDSQIAYLHSLGFHSVKVCRDPNNDDYLYLSSDLMCFKGRKYHDKRNHINRFNREYSIEYIPLTSDLVATGKGVLDNWCSHNFDEQRLTNNHEEKANLELLNNYAALGCKGALFSVDGKFEALFIGEMLNSTTAVIHLEKANRNIKGLYTVCTQQFCRHEWSNTRYINLEQDLGLPGLRQSKRSYNPYKIIEKYIAIL